MYLKQYEFKAGIHDTAQKYDIEPKDKWEEEVKPFVYQWDHFRNVHCFKEIREVKNLTDPV